KCRGISRLTDRVCKHAAAPITVYVYSLGSCDVRTCRWIRLANLALQSLELNLQVSLLRLEGAALTLRHLIWCGSKADFVWPHSQRSPSNDRRYRNSNDHAAEEHPNEFRHARTASLWVYGFGAHKSPPLVHPVEFEQTP